MITLYRLETSCHEGPYHSDYPDDEVIDMGHTPPCDMVLSDDAYNAINSGSMFFFFSNRAALVSTFILTHQDSPFRVKCVDVPLALEFDKMFRLDEHQIILDSDIYLNYVEQGKVLDCPELTALITTPKR